MALDSHIHLFRPGRDGDPRTLLMLHGTGGDEASFAGLGPVLAPGAAVLSVRGNVSEHGMNRFFRRRAEGVYDMEDLAFRTRALGAFVEAAVRHYEIVRDRLIAVGYSNGANILANLLFQEPALVPAAVLMHPLIPFAPEDQPGLAGRRILITAGERDPICPPAVTRAPASSSPCTVSPMMIRQPSTSGRTRRRSTPEQVAEVTPIRGMGLRTGHSAIRVAGPAITRIKTPADSPHGD